MRVSIWPGATALADQGGREVQIRNASHVGRRNPTAEVDHDPASEQHDHVAPADLRSCQPVEQLERLARRLVSLPGRDRGHLGLDARLFEGADHGRPVQLGHIRVRDHGHVRAVHELQQPLHGGLGRAGNDDRVGVAPLRPPLDRAAGGRQLDGIDGVDEVPAEQLRWHAASVRRRGRR
jgi:hypothetical protein